MITKKTHSLWIGALTAVALTSSSAFAATTPAATTSADSESIMSEIKKRAGASYSSELAGTSLSNPGDTTDLKLHSSIGLKYKALDNLNVTGSFRFLSMPTNLMVLKSPRIGITTQANLGFINLAYISLNTEMPGVTETARKNGMIAAPGSYIVTSIPLELGRFSVGTYTDVRGYIWSRSRAAKLPEFTLYGAPYLVYQASPIYTAELNYELSSSTSTDRGWSGLDQQLAFILNIDIAKKMTLSPVMYSKISGSDEGFLNRSSVGLRFSASL